MMSPSNAFFLNPSCFICSSQSLTLLKDYVDNVLLKYLKTPIYISVKDQNGIGKKLLLMILPLISEIPDRSESSTLSLLLIMQQLLQQSPLPTLYSFNKEINGGEKQ